MFPIVKEKERNDSTSPSLPQLICYLHFTRKVILLDPADKAITPNPWELCSSDPETIASFSSWGAVNGISLQLTLVLALRLSFQSFTERYEVLRKSRTSNKNIGRADENGLSPAKKKKGTLPSCLLRNPTPCLSLPCKSNTATMLVTSSPRCGEMTSCWVFKVFSLFSHELRFSHNLLLGQASSNRLNEITSMPCYFSIEGC